MNAHVQKNIHAVKNMSGVVGVMHHHVQQIAQPIVEQYIMEQLIKIQNNDKL